MRYFELLRQVKEKHGALSSREEKLIYDAISIYNDSFDDKEEQFKMELASGILVRNSEKLLDGTGRKELAIMGSISLAEAFVRMWKDNLKCVFYAGIDSECHFPLGDCADDYRSDKNNVIFEEVK